MAQIVNAEYFYLKCNQVLGTNYNADNWGGADNIKRPVNIEWLVKAVQKVYNSVHQPQHAVWNDGGSFKRLSNTFKDDERKLAVDKDLADKAVNYLSMAGFTEK